MQATGVTLEELEPVYGDPKIVEVELAKLRVSYLIFNILFFYFLT